LQPVWWADAMAAATDPTAIARLLAKHGLAPQPPPERRAPLPLGQLAFAFG